MSRLVSAGFQRLFKSLCFKIYLIFSAGYILTIIIIRPDHYPIDTFAFSGPMLITLAAAVFTAMFIGREYSDGTIRNKLSVGHKRIVIYLSNLIVCAAANAIALGAYFIITFGIGIPAAGIEMPLPSVAVLTICAFIALTAVSAVFLFISMLFSGKAAATAVLILSAIFMLGVASFIQSRLKEPEYYGGMELVMSEEGEFMFQESEKRKNPNYLSEDARKVFEFFNDFLPFSQLYRIAENQPVSLPLSAAYDAVVIVLFTGTGILLFAKKDLK